MLKSSNILTGNFTSHNKTVPTSLFHSKSVSREVFISNLSGCESEVVLEVNRLHLPVGTRKHSLLVVSRKLRLISSSRLGSWACRAGVGGALVTVLVVREVEAGTRWVGGLSLEEERGRAACVEAAVEGSCYSPAEGRLVPSWAADMRRGEAEGLEVGLRAAGKHGGDTGVLEVHSWAAWGRRGDPLSS